MGKKLVKMIGIRVTNEMYESLERMVDRTGLRVADLGRWALAEMLRKENFKGDELWEQWHNRDGNPYYLDEHQDGRCFFCDNKHGERHMDSCVYISVCRLLKVEPV